MLTDDQKKIRELRRHLKNLVMSVTGYLRQLDVAMKEPATVDRGRKIAQLSNALDMAKDEAAHFGLGIPLNKLPK